MTFFERNIREIEDQVTEICSGLKEEAELIGREEDYLMPDQI